MSDTKKIRIMTAKGFLHKASGKTSADAFLAQHRIWLTTGNLADITSPILAKLDAKEILPTPAKEAICNAVLTHMMVEDCRKAEESMARQQAGGNAKPKNWIATIYNAKGEVCDRLDINDKLVALEQGFELNQECERWVDRRLVEGASDWYGVIAHSSMTKNGEPFTYIIMRNDAMARMFRAPKAPFMRKMGSKGGKFGVKAEQDRAYFSRG